MSTTTRQLVKLECQPTSASSIPNYICICRTYMGVWHFINECKIISATATLISASTLTSTIVTLTRTVDTHSCPYESGKSVTLRSSQARRSPNRSLGRNPFSARITKYTKNPPHAWIIPIWPYAMPINLQHTATHWALYGTGTDFHWIPFYVTVSS